MRYFLFIIIVFSLSSCFKEELPVERFDRGDVISTKVDLGSAYGLQAYFDLGTNSLVKVESKMDWDIAFDCSDGAVIRQNTAVSASASVTSTDDFDSVNSSTPTVFTYDHHSGSIDSLAMGKWYEHGKVIIIDRGYTSAGLSIGKLKFQMISLENDVYRFRYSKLNGADYNEATVTKNSDYNYVGFSFASHEQLYHEPKKADYDLCFTSYIYIFYEPEYTPYSVVGALINSYNTVVHRDISNSFSLFDYNAIDSLSFTNAPTIIGHDWKYYSLESGQYTTYPQITYIIRDSEGDYYKLHFTDYYNDQGQRGCPNFEFQRL